MDLDVVKHIEEIKETRLCSLDIAPFTVNLYYGWNHRKEKISNIFY